MTFLFEVFSKVNDFYTTYDSHQAYSYGYKRSISEWYLDWCGKNTIYYGKMHNKIILRRILHLSSILSGSKILWCIETEQHLF